MTTWNQENFTSKPWLFSQVRSGDTFLGGSIASYEEDTIRFAGLSNLKFYGTNTNNCILPASSKVHDVSSVKASYEDIDPKDPSKGKRQVQFKGKREHTPMNLRERDEILSDDNLKDRLFFLRYKKEIIESRARMKKFPIPPKLVR